ncbi:MAG: DNA-3-methyladenine glycosylase family protein [Lachnospiraceae bacterium]
MYFPYGEKETEYLKSRDKKLGEAIERIGHVYREVDTDLFSSVVHQIAGQQISNAALETVWGRLKEKLGEVTPENVLSCTREELKGCGISFRKADYIREFAQKVMNGEFEIEALTAMTDAEVVERLSSLRGIGVWTAEMLLIFCMKRPDVVSFGDLGIQRGMRMLYHHKKIDKKLFDKYARRYSPYGTVASLYLWAIAAGALSKE